jgi:hypothetical protein
MRWNGSISLREITGSTNPSGSDHPGVDLSALQTLIRDCGGHLWMTAEPPGDMLLKIHLPQGKSDRAAEPRAAVSRVKSGRAMGRWFRTRH